MSNQVPFIWYELMTDDADAASAFYGTVVGWSVAAPDPAAPLDYRMIFRSDGGGQGGMLQLSAEMKAEGAFPAWVPYFHVPEIDAAVDAIVADGGRVLGPRMDIPEGSFAMVTDPFGTPFYLMKPNPPQDRPDAGSDVFARDKAQHVRWHDLASPDLFAAKAFYAKHFGFAFNTVMPMGDMGDYCFIDHGDLTLGGLMQRQDPNLPPLWTLYFGVPDIDVACTAITAGGGAMLWGPNPVPGDEFSAVARDPQGAVFGVVGPKGA